MRSGRVSRPSLALATTGYDTVHYIVQGSALDTCCRCQYQWRTPIVDHAAAHCCHSCGSAPLLFDSKESYSQFIMNFDKNKLESTLPELLNMFKNVDHNIKVSSGQILVITSFKDTKRKSKGGFGKASKKAKTNQKAVKTISSLMTIAIILE
ncbi:unnamed protein product [Fraxinus pennsylvanica]|uniref:Uncharacterized protein n=1 Tax=Fraxinus pennsylvanica TaxID=56036 RepID=A0AAD2DM72_9LAMI|nr:unnamed protein product [Fraxinus pennsylvanica]